MKLGWIGGAIAIAVAACSGKVDVNADGGALDDAGARDASACNPVGPANECASAGGVCGSSGSTQCSRGYKPSVVHSCTDPCDPGAPTVICCVPYFDENDASPPPDASPFTDASPFPDASPPPPPRDASPPPPIDAATMCSPSDVSMFMPPPYVPPRRQQGACTSAAIKGYYDNCLMAGSTQATCTMYKNANAACAACLMSSSMDSSWGPLVALRSTVYINQSGCMDLVGGQAGHVCAVELQASQACDDAACGANCPVTDDASFQLYQACIQQAAQGGCSFYTQQAQCANAQSDGGAAVCVNGQTFQDLYTAVAPIFCGP